MNPRSDPLSLAVNAVAHLHAIGLGATLTGFTVVVDYVAREIVLETLETYDTSR